MTLDEQYALWAKDGSEEALNGLMEHVRQRAMTLTRDDDIAQQVAMTILGKLHTFEPQDQTAFTRYVSSTVKNRRLQRDYVRTFASIDDGEWEETSPEHGHSYVSLSAMTVFQKQIATAMIQGYSLKEIAGQLSLKESTLRKKLFDLRNEKPLPKDI
ncbi:hypothetical protein [Granulicella sp. dw_53]|uniref:RNA polymerase sigma factor n=1 Tax=Granulicella sp. dw_53 TaxID=2719792 RepID=UPI001BD6B1A5|nr:hypothetical protein [Granulicella sp. dw_53]